MSSQGSSTEDRAEVTGESGLKGRRILVVEDSPVVGPFTAELLADLGCEVVGPAPNMAAARELVESGDKIDAAMMDVHIRGDVVFALCDVLAARGVPFVLTSGYADWQMPDKWEDRPRLQKPYTIGDVEEALIALVG